MQMHFSRLPACLTRAGMSRSQWYSSIAAGEIPPPIHLGRASVWPAHEIDAVLAAIVRGASAEERRALVRDQLAARATAGLDGVQAKAVRS